ncbi:hypothetical protein HPB51_022409 [Rhipicephalus microplus]|uniref:Uncharacterized protein n=1 Tax=Rhipicephalus microplus TaxID=6941 RepID=A0A9J6DR01_RHIMP|nr:hypothetical protein HPB51_022409 [Rhipicephalus microplus]
METVKCSGCGVGLKVDSSVEADGEEADVKCRQCEVEEKMEKMMVAQSQLLMRIAELESALATEQEKTRAMGERLKSAEEALAKLNKEATYRENSRDPATRTVEKEKQASLEKTGLAGSTVARPSFSEVVVGQGGNKAAGVTGASSPQVQNAPAEKSQHVIIARDSNLNRCTEAIKERVRCDKRVAVGTFPGRKLEAVMRQASAKLKTTADRQKLVIISGGLNDVLNEDGAGLAATLAKGVDDMRATSPKVTDMAGLSVPGDEEILTILQDEKLLLDVCKQLLPEPGDSEHEYQDKVAALSTMLRIQEDQVLSQVDRELHRLREELVFKVRSTLDNKLRILDAVTREARVAAQGDESAKSGYSDSLLSLFTFEVKRVQGFACESFAYIRGSAALPHTMHFIENYEEHVYRVGSVVKIYYLSAKGCDPCLMRYITARVSRGAGEEEIEVSNADLMNGMYLLEFSVCREGTYEVRVALYDRDISGSPQRITVHQSAVGHEVLPIHAGSSDAADEGQSMVASFTDAAVAANIRCAAAANATYADMTKVAISEDLRVSDLAPEEHHNDLSMVPGFSDRAVAANIRGPAVGSATYRNMTKRAVAEDLPVSYPPEHYNEVDLASTNELQPVLPTLLSTVAGPSSSNLSREIPEPHANNAFSRFFTPIEPPLQVAVATNSGILNGQKSPQNGFTQSMASSKEQSSSGGGFQRSLVALNEEASLSSSSLLYDKPGSSPSYSDFGICVREPLKPTYVVTAIAPDSSTRRSAKVSPLSTCKKKPVSFSGTISAKLSLEFDAYKNSKLAFPIGVTATASGNIIVADTSQDRVMYRARRKGVKAWQESKWAYHATGEKYYTGVLQARLRAKSSECFRRPSAVVAFKDESYAVKDDRCIYYFSKHGEFIRALGKSSLSRPYGLSCMYKTDLKGALVCTFGTKGKEHGKMFEPSGVSATDRCIFIGDSKNNRVQAFDADGKFITVVKMTSGITRPSGIFVSDRNKLYVLNYLHGTVGVYDLKFNE